MFKKYPNMQHHIVYYLPVQVNQKFSQLQMPLDNVPKSACILSNQSDQILSAQNTSHLNAASGKSS